MILIDIITIFPDFLNKCLDYSIIKRAIGGNFIKINVHNLRDYSMYRNKKVDDYCYGGESGMVLMVQPLANCIDFLLKNNNYDDIIYLSPDAKLLNQSLVNYLSTKKKYIIICGHYKGIDERIRNYYVFNEISIGDYVLSGGELPALVLINAISRVIPGVVKSDSVMLDSFQNGILSAPIYTRPYNFNGLIVPNILLSGNKKQIDEWKHEEALKKTKKLRPDLLKK